MLSIEIDIEENLMIFRLTLYKLISSVAKIFHRNYDFSHIYLLRYK